MSLTIAQIGDMHLDEKFPFDNKTSARTRFDKVLQDIEKKQISHIVCTGDIGEAEGIPYFFEQLAHKNLQLTLGNHDHFDTISKHYSKGADLETKKMYHSILTDHHKLIYLDSSEGVIDRKQMDWLRSELTSRVPILIFMHHPILGLDLKVDEIGRLKNRAEVVKLLTSIKNQILIFCGHYHMEYSTTYKNINQFITPAISFQIQKSISSIEIDTSISGYRIIQLDTSKISSTIEYLSNAD